MISFSVPTIRSQFASQPKTELDSRHVDASGGRSLRVMFLIAALYVLIGVAFAEFARWSMKDTTVIMWRRVAWLVSGIAFAAHIGLEHFRLRNSPRKTGMYTSVAAALGACGLVVAANVPRKLFASGNQRALAIALVAWPLLTGVPAFVVAMVAAALLNCWSHRS
jgi:hypothetical protein